MGLITFKVKSGAQLAINTTNIVSIERQGNIIIILYNVSFNRGLCMKGRLHSDKYEYKSEDDAIETFRIMCSLFDASTAQEPNGKSLKSLKETL